MICVLSEAWTLLDKTRLVLCIHPRFQYDSQWVFASMNAEEYCTYISGKFKAIRASGSRIDVRIIGSSDRGAERIMLPRDGGEPAFLDIRCADGKIIKMDLCMF